ncbi:MAG: hotdog fold thioesterase [Thermoanaerobaculaceae bacterium]|nr:hotdog fold thioesterase [Thermoanaerobaculaceae bacterium]
MPEEYTLPASHLAAAANPTLHLAWASYNATPLRGEVPLDLAEFAAFVEKSNPHTVFAPLGIRVPSFDPDLFQVALDIDSRHLQHLGMLHGGVSALLAESAASMAAAASVDMRANTIAGVDLNATHLKGKRSGTITATARPLFRGKNIHVYSIDITDEEGDLVCAARCTIAVRPRQRSADADE